MKKIFVSYLIALQLKEKEFHELCIGWWFIYSNTPQFHLIENDNGEDNNFKLDLSDSKASNTQQIEEDYKNSCSAPTYEQVIDWFKEKHNIEIWTVPLMQPSGLWYSYNIWNTKDDVKWTQQAEPTVAKALEKAFEIALKLI